MIRYMNQLCFAWNITMGLYWIRPYAFINLDSRNRWFIADTKNMPGEVVVAAGKTFKKVPYAADYLGIKDLCKKVWIRVNMSTRASRICPIQHGFNF